MKEKTYTRYIWIFLIVMSLLELQFGLSLAIRGPAAVDNSNKEIQGVDWEQIAARSSQANLIDYFAKSWGVTEAFVAITMIAIAAIPFRKGEKWSWYFLWLYPAFALTSVIHNFLEGATSVVLVDSFAAIIFAAALLLAYRKFFPRV